MKRIEVSCDLVEEILARVPAKDLLRFRRVCKRWKSLIQDKQFIKKHVSYSPTKFLYCAYNSSAKRHLVYEYKGTRMLDNNHVRLFLHCNGLICLCFWGKYLAVWNPALRELRKIEPATIKGSALNMIGFGYDHSNDDHKIVLLTYRRSPSRPHHDFGRAEVISLKTGSRVIDYPSYAFDSHADPGGGTLVGNRIFWLVKDPTNKDSFILSFDLVSHQFNRVSCPSTNARIVGYNLSVIRGHLCVVEYRVRELCIWSGQSGKGVHSWSRLFTVSVDDIKLPDGHWVFGSHVVECETKDMELLVKVSNWFEQKQKFKVVRVSAFNTKENVFTKLEIDYSCGYIATGPCPYKESLLSVHG
ncbi:PREDICTED: putative F-box protein At3g16210 [Tarenaya hassleriana]|uniref:putative F-box protein At3g16210 n=1 Tax=Tarenaya hassleriana TaxID=28532 RepID=UPI00053C6E29|nr:PREDICTED: putative F-box protein At3g16210 [Tarenaya hassleriana]